MLKPLLKEQFFVHCKYISVDSRKFQKFSLQLKLFYEVLSFIIFLLSLRIDVVGSGSGLKRHTDPSLLKTLTVQNKHLKCTFWGYYVLRVIKYFYLQKNVSQTSSGERLGDSQTCLVNTHDV